MNITKTFLTKVLYMYYDITVAIKTGNSLLSQLSLQYSESCELSLASFFFAVAAAIVSIDVICAIRGGWTRVIRIVIR